MALFKKESNTIDQPSEDLIDIETGSVSSMSEEVIDLAKPKQPLFSGMGTGGITTITSIPVLIIGAIVAGGAAAWLLFTDAQKTATEAKYIEQSSQLLMLSQRLAKDAREAVLGQSVAFKSLQQSRNRFETIIKNLIIGNSSLGIPASPAEVRPALNEIVKLWSPGKEKGLAFRVDQILKQQKSLLQLRQHVVKINQLSPLLLALSDEIVEAGTTIGLSKDMLYIASRQGMLSQRIAKDVNLFSQGGTESAVAAAQFGKDTKLYQETEARLRRMAPAAIKARLAEAAKEFGKMKSRVDAILGSAAELFEAQRASKDMFQKSDPLLASARKLVDSYTALSKGRQYMRWMTAGLGVISVFFLLLFLMRLFGDTRKRAYESDQQNRTTQDAILKLLEEMGDLAEGDLSIEPEVTEQITGAIADSINFAVKEMRNLVVRIKNAAQQVADASERSRQTAIDLTEATLRQAAQITETTESVKAMARSMEDMSLSAEKSAEVAKGSVDTAKRGAVAVQDTIKGMDEMREQIQETAKRIKRLGESSQQIGEIVELINDIAEQTNILSLNAAIQAAMAGEAGRGFAVVADEVQRLAERSAEATKQISDLVKTIQADTNEAVASMEQATHGVVGATRLADAAGQALGEIEAVSLQISDLIVDISRDAHRQSESATGVSDNMAVIQETTTMTSNGTRETAESIGKLSDLARELQASVAGFKLPA